MSYDMEEFRHGAPARIFGSETEYTSPFNSQIQQLYQFVPDDLIAHGFYNKSLWLKNGARLYRDLGDVIEYATPECHSGEQVLCYEKAGEQEVSDIVRNMGIETNDDEIWRAYKRSGYAPVRDENGEEIIHQSGVGHHENYLSSLDLDDCDIASRALESYLSTRAIWAGAGLVGARGYEVHQKASDITSYTHQKDNYVYLSSVDYGRKIGFQSQSDHRLEIRLGDGNISAWAIRTKYAMTSFVLRLIEHESFPEELTIDARRGPLRRKVSQDPNAEFQTADKQSTTAALHQKAIARACLDFATKHPLLSIPKEELTAALAIETLGSDIDKYLNGSNTLHELAVRIDWAAKLLNLHNHGIPSTQISTSNMAAVKYDLQWEQLGSDSASARWYRSVHNEAEPYAVARARTVAPKGRAHDRVDFLLTTDINVEYVEWRWAIAPRSTPHENEKIILFND